MLNIEMIQAENEPAVATLKLVARVPATERVRFEAARSNDRWADRDALDRR